MTSQLVLMNSNGVSISSDSAVTTPGNKTFNSVNKIIQLPKHKNGEMHKVGFLISGTASFVSSGQSWAHVIWRFHEESLNDKNTIPGTVEEYAKKFKSYILSKNKHDGHIHNDDAVAYGIYEGIYEFISKAPYSDVDSKKYMVNPTSEDREYVKKVEEIRRGSLETYINDFYDLMPELFKSTEKWTGHLIRISELTHNMLSGEIDGFEDVENSENFVNAVINELMYEETTPFETMFWRNGLEGLTSTICIIGYGKDEHYPSLIRMDIKPGLSNKPKTIDVKTQRFIVSSGVSEKDKSVGEDGYISRRPAFILPFAQKAQLQTLINGISNDFRQRLELKIAHKAISELPQKIAQKFHDAPGFGTKTTLKALEAIDFPEVTMGIVQSIEDTIHEQIIERRDKMRGSVRSLPLMEMHDFSELLIRIESQIKYYTEATRSVGGNIDVAEISLESGFSWRKRK